MSPSAPLRPPQTWASGGLSAEFRSTPSQWRGGNTNQHPSFFSSARPPRPRNTQVLSHHHMRGVGHAFVYQGTGGGSSGSQIPLNLHHSAHTVNPMPPHPLHSGGPRGYNAPMVNKPGIPCQSLGDFLPAQNSHQGYQGPGIANWHPQMTTQSLGACALQSSMGAAIPPQQSPPKQDLSNPSTATAQSPQPADVLSFEDTSSINSSSSVGEEAVPMKIALATEPETCQCPFPECKKKCGRFQELERHIYERHLPPYLFCEQPGCDLTSSRLYLLKSHRADKHPDILMPEQDAVTIYDAKVLAKQVRTKEIDIEQAVYDACSLFEKKAEQMGKLGIWRWVNGLSI